MTPPTTPPATAVHIETAFDGPRRVVTISVRRMLDIAPVTFDLPFPVLKALAAQLLAAEARAEQRLAPQRGARIPTPPRSQ